MNKKIKPRWVPDRDVKYMSIAWMVSRCSKDPSSQIGALIISEDNKPLGWGYNGPPPQMVDAEIDWSHKGKKGFIRHAERNAIAFSRKEELVGSTIYVTGRPCNDCLGEIVANGIARVCFFPMKHPDPDSVFNSKALKESNDEYLKKLKVNTLKLDEFKGDLNWMRDEIEQMKKYGVF